MESRQIAQRARLWAVIAVACFAALAGRLFHIQILQHERYRHAADEIKGRTWPIEAPRGNVYDRNGNPLALNLKLYSVAADPKWVNSPAEVAAKLTPLLRADEEELARKLSQQGRRYVRLQEAVDQPTADAIKALDSTGLIVTTQWKRVYPHGPLGASLLGFVGRDRVGLSGIERALDSRLAGSDGEMVVALDGRRPQSRAQIPGRTMVTREMEPGSSATLTIDLTIQAIAEEELAKAVENARAAGGAAIVMDPDTGDILALATQPGFDPNEFWRYPRESWVSHAVVSPYEPGSTFKVITACAAIEEGVMSHGETYHCTGSQAVGRQSVKCALHGGTRAHGTLDLDEIIVRSCNSGIAQVGLSLGAQRLHRWVQRFGFGELTGIEVAGESRGILAPPSRWSQMQVANVAFGQGISVTPIQLLAAYCTIANGGYQVHPRVIQGVTEPGGEVRRTSAAQPERVLSEGTAARMREAMTRAVEEGTGKAARIPGRQVAGKTGTAQKPTPEAGFRSGKYIGSFAGFAPADDPRLAAIIVIDEPRNGYYGGVVAAPAFRAICERALTALRVPPTGADPSKDLGVSVAAAPPSD